jgi:threonine aldolase
VSTPDSNIVLVPTSDAATVVAGLDAAGVRAVPFGPGVRFVTHRDVSRDDVEAALERAAELPVPA